MNNDLSILIPTSGKRLKQLKLTLCRILSLEEKVVEVIVINQGNDNLYKKILRKIPISNKLHWYNQSCKGKTNALNFGVSIAKGSIFVIVDDDVIISKKCFDVIISEFNKSNDLSVLLGRVKPYLKHNNKELFCPSLSSFVQRRQLTINKLFTPNSNTSGSIMAIRLEVFSECGLFCKWLGPGTLMGGADDWEFCYRLVSMDKKIILEPDLIVFHNKFLNLIEYRKLINIYFKSTTAFCFYLALKYKEINFIRNWKVHKNKWMEMFHSDDIKLSSIKNNCKMKLITLIGVLVGCFYGLRSKKSL